MPASRGSPTHAWPHASAAMTLDIYADLFESNLDDRLDHTRAAALQRARASGPVLTLR